jgi:outer membrane protein assembly factor BamB/tetratricopeptide (TPR) repeat protein
MVQSRQRRWLVASLLTAFWGALPGGAVSQAQLGVAGDDGAAVSPAVAADAPAGISVPDSPAAVDLLQKAAEKERQHQWAGAVDLYQQVLARYAARVSPSHIDADNGIFRYQGVAMTVQEQMARWPGEGLAAYRAAVGSRAADALAAANPRDVGALESIFWNYFPTDAGKSAGLALLDLNLEAGQFAAAAFFGQRLLDLHPNLAADRAAVLFRTAAAYHDNGDDAGAAPLQQELATKFPGAIGHIAGKDVMLSDALAGLLKSPAPAPQLDAADADRWPLFGGPAGWGGVSPSAARPGASITRIDLLPPTTGAIEPERRLMYQQTDDADMAQGQGLGTMPVAGGEGIFFQDGRHLYAINPDSGRPLPGWEQTYPGSLQPAPSSAGEDAPGSALRSGAGVYSVEGLGRPRGEQLTVCLTPASVVALMGQRDRAAILVAQIAVNAPGAGPRLICLDRATGRERWTRSPSDLPETAGPVRNGDFIGSPLLVPTTAGDASTDGQILICTTGGGHDRAFTDSYVVALSAKTGGYLWSCYVGSATQSFDGEVVDTIDTPQLALDQGRVLVLSNLGTVAALQPSDGRMLWLNTYPRSVIDTPEAAAMFMRARLNGATNSAAPGANVRPWTQSPILTEAGKAYVLPADGKDLLVYAIATGIELKRIATADYDNASALLGVRGGVALLTTDKGCYAIDTDGYDAADPARAIAWDIKDEGFADTIAGDDNTVFGRGFLTADSVFIPTRHRLYQLSWSKGGKVMSMYPSHGAWLGGQEPGNVLVTSQNVIVAGSHSVDVYTDIGLVRRRYDAQVAAAPNDPAPRIALAEALFNAGETDAAVANLDQAIALVGGAGQMRPGPGRQLVYTASLDFARHLAADATGGGEPAGATPAGAPGELPANIAAPGSPAPAATDATAAATAADGLFDRAGGAADSPAEQSAYRLARAGFDRDRKDFADEVTLCQQVLADPAQRAAGGEEAAADIAAVLLVDPTAYAPVEKMAVSALDTAVATHDPAALAAVADIYPNAKAAVAAWEQAADLYEGRGQFGLAVDMLRRVYGSSAFAAAGSAGAGERGRLEMAMARNLAAMPGDPALAAGRAIDRLAAAVRWVGVRAPLDKAVVIEGGERVEAGATLEQAVAALQKIQNAAELNRLPDLGIVPASPWKDPALYAAEGANIGHVTSLLLAGRNGTRTDRIVTWSPLGPGGGVVAYAAGRVAPLWTAANFPDQPTGIAWIGASDPATGGRVAADRLAIWTTDRLQLLDANTGQTLGHMGLRDAASVAVVEGEVVSDAGAEAANADNLINNGQFAGGFAPRPFRVARNGMVVRVFNNGAFRMALAANAAAPAAPAADERIAAVQSAGNRVLVMSSTGRIVALDAGDAHVVWQFRLDQRAPDALLCNDRFTVLRSDDGTGALLAVLDTASGRVIGRRRFGAAGTAQQLVNAALSEEGTLALTLTTKLQTKDLYEPWRLAPQELGVRGGADATNFTGMDSPDQLLVHGGRVVAMYDLGASIRVHELCTHDADERDPLGTGASSSPNVTGNVESPPPWMRLIGPRLYALHSKGFAQYNLDAPADHYLTPPYYIDFPPHIRDAFFGRQNLVLLDQPVDRGPTAGAPFDRLLVYSRAPVSATVKRESGRLEYAQTVQNPAGILAWQPIDGGLCYLSADQTLHQLMGGRVGKP